MIQKSVRTTEGQLNLKIPTTLDELTIGQLALLESDTLTDIEAISILSYCPLEELYNIRNMDDIAVFKDAVTELTLNLGHYYNSEDIPESVTVSGKEINVIKNLGVEPVGAFMNAKDIIAEEINKAIKKFGEDHWQQNYRPSTQACIEVLAHYFYCRVTGKKYSEIEANRFQDQIKYMPVSKGLPIARFFFLKYPDLGKQKVSYLKLLRMLIQERLALRRLKRSARLTRLTH